MVEAWGVSELPDLLGRLGRPRVLVVGDLILDRYVWGAVERVSPEAPVLVVRADRLEVRPGGAASVAALLHGLDAEVGLAGIVGEDSRGAVLAATLRDSGVSDLHVLSDQSRVTTVKERLMGRTSGRAEVSGQQILRVDYEECRPLDAELEDLLIQRILSVLRGYQALLISDYGKGVCTPRLLKTVITAARQCGIPVLVDPARNADFSTYAGADVLVPNRAEAEHGSGRKISTVADAQQAAHDLLAQCGAEAVALKLDRDGILLLQRDASPWNVAARPREVCDVTGAGDVVLAMLGLCLAGGVSLPDAVVLANAAAGLEVERVGVVPVSRAEVREALRQHGPEEGKLVDLDQMSSLADRYRQEGKSVVFTNGCFDLLHVGHIRYLQEASRLGDVLIVALNSDASVRRLKGAGRPVIGESDRAALVAALECVRHVLIFDSATPRDLLRRIRPGVLVKGGGYAVDEVIGREIVEADGGQVCVVGQVAGISTTRIMQRIASLAGADHE